MLERAQLEESFMSNTSDEENEEEMVKRLSKISLNQESMKKKKKSSTKLNAAEDFTESFKRTSMVISLL